MEGNSGTEAIGGVKWELSARPEKACVKRGTARRGSTPRPTLKTRGMGHPPRGSRLLDVREWSC